MVNTGAYAPVDLENMYGGWIAVGNWAINNTVNVLNMGWTTNSSGDLDFDLGSRGLWKEALMNAGVSALQYCISFGLEGGYTGYGSKKEESLLAYTLNKGLEMAKYGIYQKGLLGEDVKTNYDRQNVFDLAGGMSFTVWQNADSEGYMSAVSLSFTSKSMRLTNAAGEFSGFAYDANRQVWKGFETIGRDFNKLPFSSDKPLKAMADNLVVDENEQKRKLEKLWEEMSKKYAGYGSSSPTKEEKKKQEEIEDKLSKSSSDKLKHLGIENSEQKDVINENTKQLGMNITEEQKSIFDKEYKKYIENSIMEGKEIKNRTRNYILSLREKGIDRSLIKDYLTVLDSLSDLTVLNNYNSFKFSDKNQRNNLTNVDDKTLGYRTGNVMCFPTSVAIALSNLGVENPVAALGMQFEDHLDDLIRNDPEILKDKQIAKALKDGVRPRTVGKAELLMISKYFGDRVNVNIVGYDVTKNPPYTSGREAKNYFSKLNKNYLSKGGEVVIGTRLTHGGHVVVYSGYDEGGIYITDPYGKASLIKGSGGNSGYDKNLTDIGETTKGYNVYVPWNKVNEFQLGYRWYMTIELK